MKDFLQAIVYAGAFAVLFIPLMVSDSMFFPFITGKNFTFRIVVEIIFAAWVLLALLDPKYRPRFSWVLVSGASLLAVMFFANTFGEYPLKSFWSNFERMDGYVMLVHFYLYFVVLAHILRTEKMWSYFLHTALFVSAWVALYGLGQSAGMIAGRDRVDSTLGNAAYMAVYMLFHIFILALVALRHKHTALRVVYALLLVLFVYILIETGTRGTFVGLVGGSIITGLYIMIFGAGNPAVRKFAFGGLAVVILAVGGLFALKDSDFVQDNRALQRFSGISLDDLTVRMTIWGMAFEGFKERPLLGWGQGNFNYVFNEQYDPSLHSQEAWFDRVHNIFFDWLIAGGILGLVAYLSIFVSCLYYLFLKPLLAKRDEEVVFTVPEQAVLIGLLAGYFAHNLVVFDNLVSYTFFAVILAFIHARAARPIKAITEYKIDAKVVAHVATPIVAVTTACIIYFVHIPGVATAQDIIDAFTTQEIEGRFDEFQSALDRNTFARQEVVEQLTQMSINLAANPNITVEVKDRYLRMAEAELMRLVEDKPNDARLHVFFASFYRSIGQIALAQEQIAIARELSPDKQSIIMEQGIMAAQQGNYEASTEFFKTAHELAPDFDTARILYGGALIYTDPDQVKDIIADEHVAEFAENPFVLQAAETTSNVDLLVELYQVRIANNPGDAQNRASLAYIHYRAEQTDEAIAVLETAVTEIPTFSTIGTCYINNLKAGNQPDAGCQ